MTGLLALAAFGVAGYLFLSATVTTLLRFGYCGPSALEHPEPVCRVATQLLLASYGTAALGIALTILTVWLHLRRINNAHRPPASDPPRPAA